MRLNGNMASSSKIWFDKSKNKILLSCPDWFFYIKIKGSNLNFFFRNFALPVIFLVFSLSSSAMSLANLNSSCSIQQPDKVGYISFDEIRDEMRRWPLSIEFSERIDNNAYLISGVHLLIIDSSDTIIFDEVVEAPFFVALLQPGNYQLIASYDEIKISQKFEIILESNLMISMNWG